jgi:hypothetical protein
MANSSAVPLTTFVDFVRKSGTPKLTVVRTFKNRKPYDPVTDFYKRLREAIISTHERATPIAALDDVLSIANTKKLPQYRALISGYKKFVGKRSIKWFDPPRTEWNAGGISVLINPELGLDIAGTRHVIKLYLKGEKVSKSAVEIIGHLMETVFSNTNSPALYGLLDVRNAHLHKSGKSAALGALLMGEAASFAAIMNSLQSGPNSTN